MKFVHTLSSDGGKMPKFSISPVVNYVQVTKVLLDFAEILTVAATVVCVAKC